ncbi:hypothetical protein DL96DRAFT_1690532 [Flagelloscypha sp. PMI_526]|nr:hypothetical protein DL96DRAFT_1690532 [Flagelloscypha sp. PMI_526]
MSDASTKATDLLLLLVLSGPPKPLPAVPPSNANDSDPGHMLEPVNWLEFWKYEGKIEISRSRQLDAFAGQYDDPRDFEWTVQQQVRVINEAIERGMFDRFDGLDKVTMIGTLHNTTDVGAEHERVFDLDGNHLSLHIDFKGREAHPCHLYTDPRGPNRAVFDQYTDEYTTPREVMTRADKAKRDQQRQKREKEEERKKEEVEEEEKEGRRKEKRRREEEDRKERKEKQRRREERDEELRREEEERTRQEERLRLERERAEREEGEEKERRLRETLLRLEREREEREAREAREGAERERRLREELMRKKAERERNNPTKGSEK